MKDINPATLSLRSEAFLAQAFDQIFAENPRAIPIIPGYIGGIEGGILKKL